VGQRVKRVAVSDTTAGRIIYLWFWRFPGIARSSFL
jgi:hypothetical protein